MTVNIDPQQTGTILSGVIPEQPDTNTIELATYGDTYLDVKSALYVIDMMLEIAKRDYERLIASCHGEEYVRIRQIILRSPGKMGQDRPHVEDYQELQDVRKAKKIYRAASTVCTLERWKVEVKAYGSMYGAYEYGKSMMETGISADLMRRVFKERASKGMTNSYASIRDMREGHLMDGMTEEERSLARMAEMILAADEYDRMEREYPEDDSAERVEREWMESRRPRPPEIEDHEEEEDSPLDPSVLFAVPDNVGLDFITEDDDDDDDEDDMSGDDLPDDSDDGSDDDMSGSETDDKDPEVGPHIGIGPVASGPEDALHAVPPEEKLRIGPGTEEEMRYHLDSKHGRIERLGPVSSSAFEAMDAVDRALVSFMPPAHPEEFAKWYDRKYLHELRRRADVEMDQDDDGGIVLIAREKEEGSE